MNRRAIQLVLVAALVAVAGCAGGTGGITNDSTADGPSDSPATVDSSDGGSGTGTAAFYVSDDPSVIDDFEHLNVTITKVGFKKTGDLSDGGANGTGGTATENESDDGESTNETSVDEPADEENETVSDRKGGEDEKDDEGETNETDGGDEKDGEDGEADDGGNDERWIEYDVNETTVDLTELKGANASMIDEFELPAGEYETVFIYVSDTEGVLADGTTTRVKLPSNRLKIPTPFTVGNGERVDFVYDIAPHKAGKSGKYILRPVISQSGTGEDVEIRDIDEKNDGENDEGKDDERPGNGNSGEKRAKAA